MNLAIKICSNALILIGARPIQSFEDGTTEASVAQSLYEVVRDSLLEEHPWKFTRDQYGPLSKINVVPKDKYRFAYQLPADYANLRSVSIPFDHDIYKDKQLLTDFDGKIFIEYQIKPSEVKLPAYFQLLLTYKLASDFSIPIREDASTAEKWAVKFEDQLKKARRTDGNQVSSVLSKKGNPLIVVRG